MSDLVGNPEDRFSHNFQASVTERPSSLERGHLRSAKRKPLFGLSENNKQADQNMFLFCIHVYGSSTIFQSCQDREADQRLCFRYIDSTIPLLSKSEISSL